MIARKLMSLLISIAMFFIVFPKILGISVTDLIPEEAKYIAFGLIMVIGGYFAMKLGRYVVASSVERHLIRRDMVRWIMPFYGYDKTEHANGPQELVVRESRILMMLQALDGIVPLFIMMYLYLLADAPGPIKAILLIFMGLIVLGSLITLLKAVIADDLVTVSPEGLGLPIRYRETIPWDKIFNVELRNRGKQGYQLFVHFKDPASPASWRGIVGKIKGYFAHQDREARLKVSLLHTNVDPYDIRSVIDQHLKARDMEVVAR